MKNKIKYLPISILTLTTAVSGAALSASSAFADTSDSRTATVTVEPACTFTSSDTISSNLDVYGGSTSTTESSGKEFTMISCNNPNGFLVKAVGMAPTQASPSEMVEGATALYNSLQDASIPTGTSGDSYWGMKVTQVFASTSTTITPGYDNTYGTIPSSETELIKFGETSSSTILAGFKTDFQVHASTTQATGAYRGAVKYVIAMR